VQDRAAEGVELAVGEHRVAVTGAQLPFSAGGDGAVTVRVDSLDLFGIYLIEYQIAIAI
jgi:hypothetical protein